jgi:hypothetical protein
MSLPKMELRFEKRRNGKDMPPGARYVLQQRFDDGPWHDVPVVDQDAEREERNMKQQDVIKSAELIAGLAQLRRLRNLSLNDGDTTDAPGKSSGLVLYKDAATGVQYVGTVMGGITLRVDRDGKPYTDPQ